MGDFLNDLRRDNERFLFADPSFVRGMATVLDLGGTLVSFNQSLTPEQADYRAMVSDWAAIGLELESAAHVVTSKAEKEEK